MKTDAHGFTLLEMLISISLIAMLMLTLLIGLRIGTRAWQRGEARLEQTHIEAERTAFLADQVSSLVPYAVTVSGEGLTGTFTMLEAREDCLRFVTRHGSAFGNQSGLMLAEYGIVEGSAARVDVLLRETPILDDGALLRRLVRSVDHDPETGAAVIAYQPFDPRATDLRLMTGLRAARFEYLDLRPPNGQGALWLPRWTGRQDALYPDAIRLRWEQAGQSGEQLMPVRARLLPQSRPHP